MGRGGGGRFLLAVLNLEHPAGRCWDAPRCSEPSGGNFLRPLCCINNRSISWWAVKTANCSHLVSLLSFGKGIVFYIWDHFTQGQLLGRSGAAAGTVPSVEPLPGARLDAGEDEIPWQHWESDGDQTSHQAGCWSGRESINITGFPSGKAFSNRMVEFGKLQTSRLPLHPLALGLGHLPQ